MPSTFEAVPQVTASPAIETGVSTPGSETTSSVSAATWDLACSSLVAESHASFGGGVISMTAPAVDLLEEVSIPVQIPAIVIGAAAAVWAVKAYRSQQGDEKRVRPLYAWERPVFF